MPSPAISATKEFLNIAETPSYSFGSCSLANGARSVDEAFDVVTNAVTRDSQQVSKTSSGGDVPGDSYSTLLAVLLDGYTNATKERDQALASLATTSIINDSIIMKERLRGANSNVAQNVTKKGVKQGNNDEDMLNLCKQLGNEIESRTSAEAEISRLKERLLFEQSMAQARENELKAKLASYEREAQDGKK